MASPIADQRGDAAANPARWPVIERSLRDRRRSLTSWALGIALYVGLIVAFWPSIRGSSEISKAIESYPDVMKEFFGGAAAFDYTSSTIVGILFISEGVIIGERKSYADGLGSILRFS